MFCYILKKSTMKKILLILITAFLSFTTLLAQEEDEKEMETLLGSIQSSGGYGAFSLHYASIDNKHAFMMGARGVWVANHSLALGVGGKGFFSEYHYDETLNGEVNLQGFYGGLHLEPILGAKEALHFAFPVMIGGGRIAHANEFSGDYYYESNINDVDGFFAIEPGVELEVNMMRYFRLSLGAYYLYTNPINLYGTPEDALNGFNFGVTFKFGSF